MSYDDYTCAFSIRSARASYDLSPYLLRSKSTGLHNLVPKILSTKERPTLDIVQISCHLHAKPMHIPHAFLLHPIFVHCFGEGEGGFPFEVCGNKMILYQGLHYSAYRKKPFPMNYNLFVDAHFYR